MPPSSPICPHPRGRPQRRRGGSVPHPHRPPPRSACPGRGRQRQPAAWAVVGAWSSAGLGGRAPQQFPGLARHPRSRPARRAARRGARRCSTRAAWAWRGRWPTRRRPRPPPWASSAASGVPGLWPCRAAHPARLATGPAHGLLRGEHPSQSPGTHRSPQPRLAGPPWWCDSSCFAGLRTASRAACLPPPGSRLRPTAPCPPPPGSHSLELSARTYQCSCFPRFPHPGLPLPGAVGTQPALTGTLARPGLSTRIPRVRTAQRLPVHNPDPARFLLSAHRPHPRCCPHSRPQPPALRRTAPQPAPPGLPPTAHWHRRPPGSRCNPALPGCPPATPDGRPAVPGLPAPRRPAAGRGTGAGTRTGTGTRTALTSPPAPPLSPPFRASARPGPARCRWGRRRVRPGPPAVPRSSPPDPPGATGPPGPCRFHLAGKEPSQGEGLERPWLCPHLLYAAGARATQCRAQGVRNPLSYPREDVLSPLQGQNISSALL